MNFLRNLGKKMADGLRRFMTGRYGSDKLNTALLVTSVVICLISAIIPVVAVKLAAMAACYGIPISAIRKTESICSLLRKSRTGSTVIMTAPVAASR